MVSSWIYLTFSVIAALIALGVVALNTRTNENSIHDKQNTLPNQNLTLRVEMDRKQFYINEEIPFMIHLYGESSQSIFIGFPNKGANFIVSDSSNNIIYDRYVKQGISLDEMRYNEAGAELAGGVSGTAWRYVWSPESSKELLVQGETYFIEAMLPVMIDDDVIYLRSSKEPIEILKGDAPTKIHALELKFEYNKADLLTGEEAPVKVYLLNNGHESEFIAVDGLWGEVESVDSRVSQGGGNKIDTCYSKNELKLANPLEVRPSERAELTTELFSLKYPGTYVGNEHVMLSVQGINKVECIKLDSVPIEISVKPKIYEGVKLVLETDKQVYNRNETVHFNAFIANNSNEPFTITEQELTISIKDSSGNEVSAPGYIAEIVGPITIRPHSTYSLSGIIALTWDQRVYMPSEEQRVAESGQYLAEAIFTSPYLKSSAITFRIK